MVVVVILLAITIPKLLIDLILGDTDKIDSTVVCLIV